VKNECWSRAEPVPGRDPERWRKDAVGNVVFRKLNSCEGCLCHDFDHVVPYSQVGPLPRPLLEEPTAHPGPPARWQAGTRTGTRISRTAPRKTGRVGWSCEKVIPRAAWRSRNGRATPALRGRAGNPEPWPCGACPLWTKQRGTLLMRAPASRPWRPHSFFARHADISVLFVNLSVLAACRAAIAQWTIASCSRCVWLSFGSTVSFTPNSLLRSEDAQMLQLRQWSLHSAFLPL